MRNLKKFLALVLAMMMTLSLMVTVNAAATSDFTDADSITKEFREGVAVLEGLGVFTGYTNGDKFDFRPKNNITRAEVATIVYRLATGDVDGDQAHLYADYQKFDDVKSDHWAAGYINYCANAEWIAGYGNGKFGPNDDVTGYQAAAMILRAVGYGKNNEFQGSGWQVQVANVTRSKGLLVNVDKTTYTATLNKAAPRELVAEILFQAGLIPQVIWTQLGGYSEYNNALGAGLYTSKNPTLAWQNFKLQVNDWKVIDKWGRPGYTWTYKDGTAATIKGDYTVVYDKTVKECEVAEAMDIDTNATFKLYVNGNTPITSQYLIEATDTVTRVGGQGRITEFYDELEHPWAVNGTRLASWPASVVMIDTFLAKVTKVTEVVKDPAGHIIKKAELHLDVWDKGDNGSATIYNTDGTSGTDAGDTTQHVATKSTNWEYAKGDFVLIQGYTDKTQGKDTTNTTKLYHAGSQAAIEKAAFETNKLLASSTTNDANIDVLHAVTPKLAKQTTTYWNAGKHQVDGADEDDQLTLFMNYAGTKTNTTFAWYFDDNGNIIGIGPVPDTVNYGVITSLWSSFTQGETGTDGTTKVYAKVLYANGEEATIAIDKFFTNGTQADGHAKAADATAGTTMDDGSGTNTVELFPQYDYSTADTDDVMKAISRTGTTTARDDGYLMVAPVASVNTASETANNNASGTDDKFGIIKGNLFKFVASADGEMTAIEVAGDGSNSARYAGHYNYGADATGSTKDSKLYKNLGYITVDASASAAIAWLDNDTRILVSDGDADLSKRSIKAYTLSELPGNITITEATEIDWADTDGDGRADFVFVTGTIEGTVTYGLFYYNGGAAQWNGADKKGTMTGWLNGEPATVNFDDEDEFNLIKNSQAYAGHLFALRMVNEVVDDVLYANDNHNNTASAPKFWTPYILQSWGTTVNPAGGYENITASIINKTPANSLKDALFGVTLNLTTNTTTVGTAFGLGSDNVSNGNPYTAATKAVYYNDGDGTGGTTNVAYEKGNSTFGTVKAGSDYYYLTPNTKVIGLGMGVTDGEHILEYLDKSAKNDVTIVYEQANVKSIVEIYVATDPNVTPGEETDVAATGVGDDVNETPATVTDKDTLESWLRNVPNTGVWYYDDDTANDGTNVLGSVSAKHCEMIYIPYINADGAAGHTVTYRIYDANGNIVYTEVGSTSAKTTCIFNLDFTSGSNAPGSWWNGTVGLNAGTYTYTITIGTDAPVTTGSFTLT